MTFQLPNQIEIHQTKQWNSLSTKPVEYTIYDANGKNFCSFEEEDKSKILHTILRNKRPFKMLLFLGGKRYYFKRPFSLFINKLRVYDEKNQIIGVVDKKPLLSFNVQDAQEKKLYSIRKVFLSKTFNIVHEESNVGEIVKQYGGTLKEIFTSADNYKITFPPNSEFEEKLLIIAANILIDFIYFEKSADLG